MAVEIDKERIDIGRDGRIRLSVKFLADSRSEAITGIPKVLEGLLFSGTSSSPWINKNGKYVVQAVYEGLIDDPGEEFDQVEIITEIKETKIENFPDRQLLIDEYGAKEEDGRLVFPRKLPRKQRAGSALAVSTRNSEFSAPGPEEDNPLWNVTSYPVEYDVAIHRFVRKKVPASVRRVSNSVVKKLPSVFDYDGEAESWYARLTRRRRIGNMWEMEMRYKQVDEFNDLKALQALTGKVRRSGLSTGSL